MSDVVAEAMVEHVQHHKKGHTDQISAAAAATAAASAQLYTPPPYGQPTFGNACLM